jgi:hypothetical protein
MSASPGGSKTWKDLKAWVHVLVGAAMLTCLCAAGARQVYVSLTGGWQAQVEREQRDRH